MTCHNCETQAKRFGKDRKGKQRYRCNTCTKTFTEYEDKPLENMYLPIEKAVMILSMLLEGTSIRSTERITGVEKKTILKLLVLAGEKSERLLNSLKNARFWNCSLAGRKPINFAFKTVPKLIPKSRFQNLPSF